MKVIALTGRAGSGKDTAALMLQILTGSRCLLPSGDGLFCPGLPGDTISLDEVIPFYQSHRPFYELNDLGDFSIYKFAWPVYQIAATLLGANNPIELMTNDFKNQVVAWGLTGRQLLQKIGTECFREVIGTQIWCDVLKNRIEVARDENVIVSDLRFLNEGEFLKDKYDAYVIRLIGRDSGVAQIHQSETEISQIAYDGIINNTLSYSILMDSLADFCNDMGILNCKYTWK